MCTANLRLLPVSVLVNMNTPPNVYAPAFRLPTSSYTRAPRRPSLGQPSSPPRFRAFEDCDEVRHFEMERLRRQERTQKKEISRQVKQIAVEDWLLRGCTGFSGVFSNF